MPENSDDFYKNLQGFNEFSSVTDLSLYRPLPDDWHIVLADITGSTKAIQEGRYRDVNMIGAACITALINALPEHTIPHVFGGDGATLAVPAFAITAVKRVLGATRRLAKNQFSLDLRVGIVPVSDIRDAGAEVLVAKYRLSPGNYVAMFTGGGVNLVDALIKAEEENDRYQIPFPESDEAPNLEGLSCRWEPLKSCRGTMMSMLVYATGDSHTENMATYREAFDGVAEIFKSDPTAASPVSTENMIFKWPPSGVRNEVKLFAATPKRRRKWFWIYFTSLVQFFLEKFDRSAGGYDAPVYRAELRANSDFRRFDDMLRMILDCSHENAEAIEALFMDLHARGKIAFGIHRSEQALMTCLVFSLAKGEHVHFIDGSDGGFTAAALQLKAQIQAASSQPEAGG
jgi:hypothetical protein